MSTPVATAPGRAAELKGWLRRQWPVPFRQWLHGRDVAVLYAGIVLVVSLMVAAQPSVELATLVERSSTNLANMSTHPFAVLLLSAFVVSPAAGLVLLVPVLIGYGEVQRWLGRPSTILVVIFGHVGATLVVMMLELTAIRQHLVGMIITVKPDVGVSYGLFAAIGVLLVRLPKFWRFPYAIACLVVLGFLLLRHLSFTNLGHTSAWLIGISLGWLLHTAVLAGRGEVRAKPEGATIT